MRGTGSVLWALAVILAQAGTSWAAEGAPPAGEYNCYVYLPKAIHVGALLIQPGGAYAVKGQDIKGRYTLDSKTSTLTWDGPPPLGFETGVLETDDSMTKLRLYRKAADIGNKWKAAVCSLKK